MSETREQIIRKAICEKLSSGVNYFTADDILAVAGIDESQLQQISERLLQETEKAQEQHTSTN